MIVMICNEYGNDIQPGYQQLAIDMTFRISESFFPFELESRVLNEETP